MIHTPVKQRAAALEYHVLDSRTFLILDFSRTGMQLLSNRSYQVGEKLSLSQTIANQAYSVTVIVTWVRNAAPVDDKLFYIGLTFTDTNHLSIIKLEAVFLANSDDQRKLFLNKDSKGFNRGIRQHQRYDVPTSILKTPGLTAVNLSEGGMQLKSIVEQSLKKVITLTLQLDRELLVIQASVVRCEKSASIYDSGFNVGVKFNDSSTGDMLIIRKYLDDFSQSK